MWPRGPRPRTPSRSPALTQAQVTEIASTKLEDLNANDLAAAEKIIAGTARSMGITVQG